MEIKNFTKILFFLVLAFYSIYQISNKSKYKNRIKGFTKYWDIYSIKKGSNLQLGQILNDFDEIIITAIYCISLLGIIVLVFNPKAGIIFIGLSIYLECLILNNPFIHNKDYWRNSLILVSLFGGLLHFI